MAGDSLELGRRKWCCPVLFSSPLPPVSAGWAVGLANWRDMKGSGDGTSWQEVPEQPQLLWCQ